MFQARQMVAAMIADARLRPFRWLALLALPIVVAACGQNGSYNY
jgi:hypothetical protein